MLIGQVILYSVLKEVKVTCNVEYLCKSLTKGGLPYSVVLTFSPKKESDLHCKAAQPVLSHVEKYKELDCHCTGCTIPHRTLVFLYLSSKGWKCGNVFLGNV